jgi:ribonuclease R
MRLPLQNALGVKSDEMEGLDAPPERDGARWADQARPHRQLPACAFFQFHRRPRQQSPRRLRFSHVPDDASSDIFLPEKEMQKVLHGDRVQVRIIGTDRRGRPEGTIVEVVDRANTHVIGRLLNENGVWVVAPEDKRIGQDIMLAGSPGKAKDGAGRQR